MTTTAKSVSVIWAFPIALSMLALSGCTVPNPPVTTVWQKLGFPQARKSVRDHLINRKGRRPDLEAKPKLLKIADLANLESPSDLLKGAAEIKAEEDLAPQKIKALKYLAGVACGCNEEIVEKAIVEGLNDCTADVRREALNVVLASTNGTNKCKNKQKRRKIKLFKCRTCQGGGCEQCSFQGCEEQSCEESVSCQSCGACCGKAVQKRLDQMAYKTKKNGCWFESLPELRTMAANALSQCPALPEEQDEEKDDDKLEVEQGSDKEKLKVEQGTEDDPKKKADNQGTQPGDSETSNQRNIPIRSVKYSSKSVSRLRAQMGTAPNPNMVLGEITHLDRQKNVARVQLENAYSFPVGYHLILSQPSGLQMDFEIVGSEKGVVMISPTMDVSLQNEFGTGVGVWIGILGY